MINGILIATILLFIHLNVWFIFSVIKKRNDVADIAWGSGFVLVALGTFFAGTQSTQSWQSILVTILVLMWGIRLAFHIGSRNARGTEDSRYANWRKTWKWFYVRSYFQIFILQSLLAFLVLIPVIFVNSTQQNTTLFYSTCPIYSILTVLGFSVWVIGFVFETVGDFQLRQFITKLENKEKLMTKGLWRYSRHPNYFGEVAQWWGIYLIVCTLPGGYLTVIGPLTITLLITKVSGIPMVEKAFANHPDFARYRQTTSVFFPFPPKKDS